MGERSRSRAAQQAREHVAANVQALRESRGFTQSGLAERLGVETRHLQMLEAAETAPGFDLLVDLAAELGVAVGDLFMPEKLWPARRGRPRKG